MTGRFGYIIEKIRNAEFIKEPFEHLAIDNLLKPDHFEQITAEPQIRLTCSRDTRELLGFLRSSGYEPVCFPGSITSEAMYLKFIESGKFDRNLIEGYGRNTIGGYGITYRLTEYRSEVLSELMGLFSGEEFTETVREKFSIDMPTTYEGGVQKNLKGYEISPHPDTSRKALTWMANIYTENDVSDKQMHTHLCRFKAEYEYVYSVWKNTDIDPVWVPWEWSKTVKTTCNNNSITIFKPDFDTLHAVRVSEDHLLHQRNQIYGNLWYEKSLKQSSMPWERLDIYRKEGFLEKLLKRFSIP